MIPWTKAALAVATGLVAWNAWAEGRVCLEAESCATIAEPMRIAVFAATNAATVPGASGGKYLEIPKGAGNPPKVTTGEATWTFEVDAAGDYTLWGRVYWLSACNSSFTVQIDDSLPFTFGKDATFDAWHWIKQPPRLKQTSLAKGRHTLALRNRQDGVKIDQLLLVLDKQYVPVGVEEVTPAGAKP